MADRVEISKRLIFINSLAGIALNVVNLGVLVWLYRYLLQRISQEEFALYPVVASVTVFLPLLTVVLSSGLGRYTLEAYAQGDERRVTQIVSTMFPLHLATGMLVLAGGCLLAWHIDDVLTISPARVQDARIMMLLMVLSFAAASILAPFQVGFHIRQKIALLNLTVMVREIVRVGILFVLVLGVSPRVLWVVVSAVSATVLWVVAMAILSRRLVPALTFRRREIHWPLAGRLTSFGGWMLMGQLAWMLRQASVPLILNKLATPLDVTCFHLGSMPLQRIQQMLGPVQQAVLPQTTAIFAMQDGHRLRSVYLRMSRYYLWVCLLVAAPLVIYSREVVRLWVGDEFLPVAAVMAMLLSSLAVSCGHAAMDNVAEAKAQVRSMNVRGLGLELFNVALTLFLVGKIQMGAVGSALATLVTVAVGYPLVNWPLGARLGEFTFREWWRTTYLPGLTPALTGTAVWLTLKLYVQPSTLWTLGSCIMCGMGVYVAVLLTSCLQPADRADIGRLLLSIGRLKKSGRPLFARWIS